MERFFVKLIHTHISLVLLIILYDIINVLKNKVASFVKKRQIINKFNYE
jgi:hypothetical protein